MIRELINKLQTISESVYDANEYERDVEIADEIGEFYPQVWNQTFKMVAYGYGLSVKRIPDYMGALEQKYGESFVEQFIQELKETSAWAEIVRNKKAWDDLTGS